MSYYSEYPKSPRQSKSYYCTIPLEHVFRHRRSPEPESEADPYDEP